MSGHHVLTDHKGHTATIVDELRLRCQTCQHTLLLPKPALAGAPTPTPPPFGEVIKGRGVAPDEVSAWRDLRENGPPWARRKPTGEAS